MDDLRTVKAEAIVWPMPYSEDIHFNGFFIDGFVAEVQPIEMYKSGHLNAEFVVFGATSMDGVTPYGYYPLDCTGALVRSPTSDNRIVTLPCVISHELF